MVQDDLFDDTIITLIKTTDVNFHISAAAELTRNDVSSTMIIVIANSKEKSQ